MRNELSTHVNNREWFVRRELVPWCDGRSRAGKAFAEVGRVDGGRLSRRHSAIEGNLLAALWHPGKTRPALAARNGFAERTLRLAASGGAGVRRRFPGILFRGKSSRQNTSQEPL